MSFRGDFSCTGNKDRKSLPRVCLGPSAIVVLFFFLPLFSVQAQTVGICDRTSQIQGEILLQLPSGTTCQTVTSAQLSGITEINLTYKNISSLKGGDFDGLSNLEVLYLGYNPLTILPEDIFKELKSLRVLYLWSSSLTELPSDLFSGLSNLTELHLSNNSLVNLPKDLFQGLKRLRLLGLSGNRLTTLPLDLFNGLSRLQFLWLYDNSLVSLPDNLFNELTGLHLLGLSDNNLTDLDEGQFDELTKLKTLNIGGNHLENLHPSLFSELTELETLWIVDTPLLTSLPANLFEGLSKLEKLNLENNALASLSPSLFDDLTNLERLDLNENQLTSLPDNLFGFKDAPPLLSVDFSGNQIECISPAIRAADRENEHLELSFDDDIESCVPEVHLTAHPNPVTEGEAVQVRAVLSKPLPNAVTIPLILTSVTAEEGDHDSTSPVNIEISGGQTEAAHIINTYEDHDLDDESFTVKVDTDNLPSEVLAGSPLSAQVIITDPDVPEVFLSVDNNSVEEGEAVTVTIELSEALTNDVTIPLNLISGTAEPDDYASTSPVNVTIAGGKTEAEYTIDTYEDDDTQNESFTVQIDTENLPSEVVAGSSLSTQIIITDPDVPEVFLSVDNNSVEEGGAVTVTIELSEALTNEVTIPLNLIPGTAESDDYASSSPVNVTITGGQTEAEYVINTHEDNDLEDESFTVQINTDNLPSEVAAGSPLLIEVTITDTDFAPEVFLSVDKNSVEEGEVVTVTIKLSEALPNDVTIPLNLISGTAESDDYASTSPVNVTITDGQTEAEHIINTYGDDDLEDESFTVQIDTENLPSEVAAGSPLLIEVTITDTDFAPEVFLSVDKNSVEEGEVVTVTIKLSEALPNDVTIPLNLISGTAESDDYASTSPVNVTITDGQTEAEHIINTYGDDDLEDESFTVQIDTENLPSEVAAGSPLSIEVTITDTDALPEVSLSVENNSVEEGAAVTVTIELSETLTSDVTIPLNLISGTAESDDYANISPVNVTITGGQTEAEHIINTYGDDDLDDESFTVQIDADNLPSEVAAGSPLLIEVTITDTDVLPEVSLSVENNFVEEGEAVTVTIELSEALTSDVTIPLNLIPRIAESDDFASTSPVNVTITDGQTEAEYIINTYEDDDTQNESFTVQIDTDNLPSEVVAGSPLSALIIITDPDAPEVSLSVGNNSVEEGEAVTVTIGLSETLTSDVTIPLILIPGTAESDDYASTSPVNVTIIGGQTEAQHTISTFEDDDFEDETFTVAIDGDNLPSGFILGNPASAEVKISDNDMPEVSLSVDQNTVVEGQSVTVTIELSGAPANNMSIPLILTPVTAESDDYDSVSPVNVEISSGQTEAEHAINTYEDTDPEDETFMVAIDGDNLPSGFILGNPASAKVKILDIDMPGILAPVSVEVDEGQSEAVQISLITQCVSNVTVTITGYENTDLELDREMLTFTRDNYNTPQTLTLIATEDSDWLNDEVTLTLKASGGGYDLVSHTLVVAIRENMGVSIEDEEPSTSVTLWGNYPNPVSDLTRIVFDLPEPAQISIRVTDLLGRNVQTTPHGWYEAGRDHTVEIGTHNLTSGVYHYTLRVDMGGQVIQQSRAMSVVR